MLENKSYALDSIWAGYFCLESDIKWYWWYSPFLYIVFSACLLYVKKFLLIRTAVDAILDSILLVSFEHSIKMSVMSLKTLSKYGYGWKILGEIRAVSITENNLEYKYTTFSYWEWDVICKYIHVVLPNSYQPRGLFECIST